MFGFGMSAKDKWHLGQVEVMMAPNAKLMGQDAKPLARQMFDTTKAELMAQHGQAIYAENLGDKLIATNKDFVAKRLAAGLSLDDIRAYCNQTMLMVALQGRYMEISEFVLLKLCAVRQTGKGMDELTVDDLTNIARSRRKTEPRWGIQ